MNLVSVCRPRRPPARRRKREKSRLTTFADFRTRCALFREAVRPLPHSWRRLHHVLWSGATAAHATFAEMSSTSSIASTTAEHVVSPAATCALQTGQRCYLRILGSAANRSACA